jgi:hypothetical protein
MLPIFARAHTQPNCVSDDIIQTSTLLGQSMVHSLLSCYNPPSNITPTEISFYLFGLEHGEKEDIFILILARKY